MVFLLLISFSFLKSEAQKDSLSLISKQNNQISFEFLGSSFPGYLLSLDYSRKFLTRKLSFIPFVGMGVLKNKRPEFGEDDAKYSIATGIFFRGEYKRNAFWGSISGALAFGNWFYETSLYHNGSGSLGGTTVYHDVNFCLTPAIAYQFQSKSEHFFIRPSIGIKMFSNLFSDNYKSVTSSQERPLFLWSGISIGGQW